ncbi:hypothetical protein FMUND_4077 [Fusarium mundagurra]|uniref:Uncharacterized protein n=1 Tax=Fusarium mundagurra TaxID=1567541 RepID=A0A8H6DKV4_9HYPO|nr:hypothetical protein FMUND_4077 [Fusarium mundagurra]
MSSLVTEFNPASPTHTELNKEVVQAVRRVLGTEKIDDSLVLTSLPRSCLFFFLETCQLQIKPDEDDINTKVRAIFTSTQVHANYTNCAPETASVRWIFSGDILGSEDDDEEEPSANKELLDWLVAGCEHLRRSSLYHALMPIR